MKTRSNLDSIFFGGASGFEDDAFGGPSPDDGVLGTGLRIGALQAVARRQLVGSATVALLVAMAAIVLAMRPTLDQTWKGQTVQQPVFVTLDKVAAMKRVELP